MPEPRPLIRNTFFVACLLAALVLLPLWRPVMVGLILGYFSEGAVAKVAARMGLLRRGRGVLAILLVSAVMLLFLIPVSIAIYRAARELLRALPDSAVQLGADSEPMGGSVLRWISDLLARWNLSLSASLMDELGPYLRKAASAVLATLGNLLSGLLTATPGFVLDVSIVLVVWWLMAVDGTLQCGRVLRWLLPWSQPRALLAKAVQDVLRGLLVANLIVSAVQAVVCTIGLLVFRIPHALALGVFSFFLAFVPVVGTAAVMGGAAIYLFSRGRVGAGLAMLLVAVIAGTVDNVLRPFFLRGHVELPVSWIFLSIMGGLALFGAPGVVLGPILIALCFSALRALEAESAPAEASPEPKPATLAPKA